MTADSTGLRDRAAELLPCPFCGPGQSMCDPYFNDMAKRWQVGCGRCGCSTGTCRTKEAAIKAWNIRALLASHAPAAPIPMVIRCPHCHAQHIDKPEPGLMNWGGEPDSGLHRGWDNPPHTSHLCHNCGAIWRDCSVETTGVESVPPGKHDRPPTNAPAGAEGWVLVPKEPTEEMLVAGAKAMAGPSPKGPQYCNGVPRIYAAMLDASPAQAATVHRCAMCNEVIPPGTICSRLRGALYHHECAEKLPFTGKHDAPVMIKLAASPAPSPATPPAEARDLVERLRELADDERDERCVNGHDACGSVVDKSQCQYCEPTITQEGQLYRAAADELTRLSELETIVKAGIIDGERLCNVKASGKTILDFMTLWLQQAKDENKKLKTAALSGAKTAEDRG